MHFVTSTTAVAQLIFTSLPSISSAFCTAFITSESLPTPEGSMITLSGEYFVHTSLSAAPKSPTSEQHMQPEFISLISMPVDLRNPLSMPISPNSFSIRITFSSLKLSFKSLAINVVFPAPRNPEIMSILIIFAIFFLN